MVKMRRVKNDLVTVSSGPAATVNPVLAPHSLAKMQGA